MKMWPFLYSLQFETGVIKAGVNGAGFKKGPALKGRIRYLKYLTSASISVYLFWIWLCRVGIKFLDCGDIKHIYKNLGKNFRTMVVKSDKILVKFFVPW